MSCPPKEFLEPSILQYVANLLHPNGLFVLNLVLRNKSLRPNILNSLNATFKLVTDHQVDGDLNEIFMCTVNDVQSDLFHKEFSNASQFIETFLNNKKN